MNRPNKYRLWDPKNNVMIYDVISKGDKAYIKAIHEDKYAMEYVGLEIDNIDLYEGDIVLFSVDGQETRGYVEYKAPRFILTNDDGHYYFPDISTLTILGNIFENLDALDGKYKLDKCPFCGNDAIVEETEDGYMVVCRKNAAHKGVESDTPQGAVVEWNQRA